MKALFILLLFPVMCYAESIQGFKIISVYDGDSFKVDLPCEIPLVCNNVGVRVNGIDTPEIKGKCESEKKKAIESKEFTRLFIENGIELRNCTKEKYGRLLCDVYSDKGNLVDALIKNKLGRKYNGGKRLGWCN